MKKVIYPDANEQLFESLNGQFARIITNDKSVKLASSDSITKEMLDECMPDKDHVLIHLVGVGDYETYGFNKNADAFPKKANAKYYKTFETNASLYREHDSTNAIGTVKKAVYNPKMGRIEIAVWANKKKASEECEKAMEGLPLSFSMGCSVSSDRDNLSGKLCKTAAEYEPWMRMRPCQYIESWNGKTYNKYAFVHNDEPTYFDISIVKNPAERVARYLEYRMAKTASSETIPSVFTGADLGSQIKEWSVDSSSFKTADACVLLKKLSSAEKDLNNALLGNGDLNLKYASAWNFDNNYELSASDISELKKLRPETIFGELSKRASILPFMSFVDMFMGGVNDSNKAILKKASIEFLPRIYQMLEFDNDNSVMLYPELIEGCCPVFESAGDFGCACDLNNTDVVQQIMDKIEDKVSLDKGKLSERIRLNITLDAPRDIIEGLPWEKIALMIRSSLTKQASSPNTTTALINNSAKKYATVYALYKMAALLDAKQKGALELDDKDILNSISQNYQYLKK